METKFIPQKIIKLLHASYNESGIIKRDVVFLLLFNIVIDAIVREAFQDVCGVQSDKDHFLPNLTFAKDSTIFTNSLKINADRTKVVATDDSQVIVYLNT